MMDELNQKIEQAQALRDTLFTDLDEPLGDYEQIKMDRVVILGDGDDEETDIEYERVATINYKQKSYAVLFTRSDSNVSIMHIYQVETENGQEYFIRENNRFVLSHVIRLFQKRFGNVFLFEV